MMGYRLNSWGSIPGRGARDFSLLHSIQTGGGGGPTQPAIHCVPGALYLEVKQPGCDADHSPPSSAKVKIDGTIPLFLHMSSLLCLIRHMVSFTF
jgi:hypothetical protein